MVCSQYTTSSTVVQFLTDKLLHRCGFAKIFDFFRNVPPKSSGLNFMFPSSAHFCSLTHPTLAPLTQSKNLTPGLEDSFIA